MSEAFPQFIRDIPNSHSTVWRIKNGAEITVQYALRTHYERLEALLREECPGFQNDIRRYFMPGPGIARMATEHGHIRGGLLLDNFLKEQGTIVLRNIVVESALRRHRIGSALIAGIVRTSEKICREKHLYARDEFDLVMCAENEDYELQGFLHANGFTPFEGDIEQCQCEENQLLRKRRILVSYT